MLLIWYGNILKSGLRGHSAKVLFTGSNPVVTSNFYMVAVAQLAEHQVVALNVARSIRVGHPIRKGSLGGLSAGLKNQRTWVRYPSLPPAYLSDPRPLVKKRKIIHK